MFAFGLEHEVALLDHDGLYVDFARTSFDELAAIIATLPLYQQDYPQLRLGDAGIKQKRWYIEGFERYDSNGRMTTCLPKGIEIRTTIHETIQGAVDELTESFGRLRQAASEFGFTPVLISFHPYATAFTPTPPLNTYELQRRQQSPEKQTAQIPMLTHGPDLNLSLSDLSTAEIIEMGRKLTYYSPFIVPFSFSSPFYQGTLWEGLSVRTFIRTGARPAVMVFLAEEADLLQSTPSLTKIARLPAEVGRIEFKACDSCADFTLYASLLALLKGLILDTNLMRRATVPDPELHQHAACHGFAAAQIRAGSLEVLQAAHYALGSDPDAALLTPLFAMLRQHHTPAHQLIASYQQTHSIEATLRATYTLQEQQFLNPQ
ncbi:glutamate-cysteine ligase family protein [Dictyobacter arantiisoli]|uniref:Glutamate--cysteine ligase n=1 Tax=Dictyobacter arantiisoli TaxID=2014874 RepID=A0A5A5TGB6_9CHLR|nr:glutamate-cysteine ligase family protein [Dictyobacter arantiisoli]GCF10621.1 hypothetical protein KDI_41850 [Dictyobacter arantiisoli]